MRIAWIGVALLWTSLALAGQDVPVAEPHTMGVFCYLDSATEGLLALERQVGQEITRPHGHWNPPPASRFPYKVYARHF